jgi:hypothetical protein
MPKVLTTNASIQCPHRQLGVSKPLTPKWLIDGGTVLCEGDSGIFPTCLPPITSVPCIGYTLQSMGLNASYIDGRRVMLETDFNVTYTGLPLVMKEMHRTYDNSTPAPIPAGQAAPPLSPELADMIEPVATVNPLTLMPYSLNSHTPALLTATFHLFSEHPLKWVLTLINEPENNHVDLTKEVPDGLAVTPHGGDWNISALAITLTMNVKFLDTLKRGDHRFFMTAVSQRGLSSYAELVLTIIP